MVCLRCHHFTRKLQIILFCHKRAKLESSVSGVPSWLGECMTKDAVMYYRVYIRIVWIEPDRNWYAYIITACPVQAYQIGIMAINIYCDVSRTNSSGSI
jgi:hypothetical protein